MWCVAWCMDGPPSSIPPPPNQSLPTNTPTHTTALPLHLLPSTRAAGARGGGKGPSATATALSEGGSLRLMRLTKEEVGRYGRAPTRLDSTRIYETSHLANPHTNPIT